MPRPPIDLDRKIRDILTHVVPLPREAEAPLPHYKRSGTDLWNLLLYVERNFDQLQLYQAVLQRHLARLNSMVLVNLIENFERFLKEVAAACVDHLGQFVLDDRFNEFRIQGSALAVHFGTDTLGKSLCESATWLDCGEINDRFRKLLADPFLPGTFYLFPKQSQQPAAERWRFETLSIVWQLRHSVVHNVGVITQSDAVKLRLLTKRPVDAPGCSRQRAMTSGTSSGSWTRRPRCATSESERGWRSYSRASTPTTRACSIPRQWQTASPAYSASRSR